MKEEIKEFFLKICDDEVLMHQFNQVKTKEDVESIIHKLGYSFSAKELKEVIIRIENDYKLKSNSMKLKKAYD